MYYRRACLTVKVVSLEHVLQEGIFYWMIRHMRGHLLYEDRFYWRVCIRGSRVYMRTRLAGGHVQLACRMSGHVF